MRPRQPRGQGVHTRGRHRPVHTSHVRYRAAVYCLKKMKLIPDMKHHELANFLEFYTVYYAEQPVVFLHILYASVAYF